MKKDYDNPAAFIIPHFSTGIKIERRWLIEALDSINQQTDRNWKIIIVDDASPSQEDINFLKQLKNDFAEKMEIILLPENKGPGNARNIGIQKASELGCPFVLLLDQDDICHPKRVEVTREIFRTQPAVGVVYSTFQFIDEMGNHVPRENVMPSICEILDQHDTNPPQGKDVWIRIATDTGYINLTSTTSVRTDVAFKYPFPNERVSEDYYAWLVYSASGAEYAYSSLIPAKYRIPQDGPRGRSSFGELYVFNIVKSVIDTRGFQAAAKLAQSRGELTEDQLKIIKIKFYIRKAKFMAIDGETEIAEDFYNRAMDVDKEMTEKFLKGLL